MRSRCLLNDPIRMNLADIMQNSGLLPTQKEVYAENINEYAEQMQNGTWDWNRTAKDLRSPMLVNSDGHIIAGHHRFIAARVAGVTIPAGVVKTIAGTGARVARNWELVIVRPDYRP